MSTPTFDPAPTREAAQPTGWGMSWVRWFNQLYNGLQAILNGATLANTTLTSPTINNGTLNNPSFNGGATLNSAVLDCTTGSRISYLNPSAKETQRHYSDNTGALHLDASPDGVNWTTTLTVATDSSLTLAQPAKLHFGSDFQSWTPTVTSNGVTVSGVTVNYAYTLRLGAALALVYFDLSFTLAGTASSTVIVSLPFSVFPSPNGLILPCEGLSGAWGSLFAYANPNTAQVFVTPHFNNWTLGSARIIAGGPIRLAS